jgi:hypothetical protein
MLTVKINNFLFRRKNSGYFTNTCKNFFHIFTPGSGSESSKSTKSGSWSDTLVFNIVRYGSKISEQNVDSFCTVWLKTMDCAEDALILIIIFYIQLTIADLAGTHGTRGPDWRPRLPGRGGGHSESSRRSQGDNHWWAHFFFFATGRSGRDTISISSYFLCMHWWFSRSINSFSLPYTIFL